MAAWSSLAAKYNQNINATKHALKFLTNGSKGKVANGVPVRYSHDRTLPIRTSKFEFLKFKNNLHFYFMLGIAPLALIVAYVDIFIGPAELALIPEGYEPEHWEYHKHPITRFFSKHFVRSPQETHERNLHSVFYQNEVVRLRKLQSKVKEMIKEKEDYQAWYIRDPMTKFYRKMSEETEKAEKQQGIWGRWIV